MNRTRIRVRYPETDRMGIVHHTHYWVWFEVGRTELMREIGCPYDRVEERHGLYFPVIALGGRYRASARYDDVVSVATQLTAFGGPRMRFEYEARCDERDEVLATGFTEHAVTGRDHRPRRLPRELVELLRGEGDVK
jgi:acyl-CoA thioester hydrolase